MFSPTLIPLECNVSINPFGSGINSLLKVNPVFRPVLPLPFLKCQSLSNNIIYIGILSFSNFSSSFNIFSVVYALSLLHQFPNAYLGINAGRPVNLK